MMMCETDYVWIFFGDSSDSCSAVFSQSELAINWVKKHNATGSLWKYPLDVSVYDWVQMTGFFNPSKEHQYTNKFITNFTSAANEYLRFENGTEL